MRDQLFIATALAASLAAALASTPAMATADQLPGQGRVVAGQVSVGNLSTGTMDLNVNGTAVINWGRGTARNDINAGGVPGFNIGSAAQVSFNGSANASVLNIDSSGNVSRIAGALNANGTDVFVANSNGIIVGAKARVQSNGKIGLIANNLLPGASGDFDGSNGSIAYDGNGGDVTVLSGASFGGGGKVVIAGGSNVNLDLGAFAGTLAVRAGRASASAGSAGNDNGNATLTVSGQQRGAISDFNTPGTATNLGTLSLDRARVDRKFVNEGTLSLADGVAFNAKLVNRKTLQTGNVTVGFLNNKGEMTLRAGLVAHGWIRNEGRIVSPSYEGELHAEGSFTNLGRIEGVNWVQVRGGDLINTGTITLVNRTDFAGTPGSVFVNGGNLLNEGSIQAASNADAESNYGFEMGVFNGNITNNGLLAQFHDIYTGSDARMPNFRDDGDYSIVNNGTIRGGLIDANFNSRLQDNNSTGSVTNNGTLDLPGAGGELTLYGQTNVDLAGKVTIEGEPVSASNPLGGVYLFAAHGKLKVETPLTFYADGRNNGSARLFGRQVRIKADVVGLGDASEIYVTADRRSDGSYDYRVSPGVQVKAGQVYLQ